MTATDELRRLLDERGVEHYDGWSGEIRYTKWQGNYDMWFLTHDSFGTDEELLYVQGINMTPEQAIAATLGNDGVERSNDGVAERERDQLKDENAKLRELVRFMWYADYAGHFSTLPEHQEHQATVWQRMNELGVVE